MAATTDSRFEFPCYQISIEYHNFWEYVQFEVILWIKNVNTQVVKMITYKSFDWYYDKH